MRNAQNRGFSLFELMAVVAIGTIILALAVTGLKRSTVMGGSRGLATAVAAELRLAREKAIAKGSPVAVVFAPGVSRSLFTLEGDTDPVVTRVVNYQGDYPHGAIAVGTYPGPDFGPAQALLGSKAIPWQNRIDDWLPSDFANHNVFMFTPNGSAVTNGLPAADGSYRLIVAMGIELSGDSLSAAGEPYTIAISQSGAVESEKGLLGGTGGVNTFGANSPAVESPPPRESSHTPEAPVIIHVQVTPPAEDLDGVQTHIIDKGEYLTLELYAKSTDGKPLYAGWLDNTEKGDIFKGQFSVPAVPGQELLERMEFFPELTVNNVTETDVWRSVWTWTPPHIAEPGDKYDLEADVKDSTVSIPAALPQVPPVEIAPSGEILFESNRVTADNPAGRWQLFTMWADGTKVRQLTKGNHDYRFASVTSSGSMVAFERNGNEVWVMNIDGTGLVRVDVGGGRNPTISPVGNAIAYMTPDGGAIRIARIDTTNPTHLELVDNLPTRVAGNTGWPNPGDRFDNRMAFSPNGRTLYYTTSDDSEGKSIKSVRLMFTGDTLTDGGVSTSDQIDNIATADDFGGPRGGLGGLFACRSTGRIYYHGDRNDPYIGYFVPQALPPGNQLPHDAGPVVGKTDIHQTSLGESEAYPCPSPLGNRLLYNETVGGLGGNYQIYIMDTADFGNNNAGTRLTGNDGSINVRPVWIRQGDGT